uniref:Uncharacterized protein n=1 Tax=Anguilla anguilla TaxID=7936 RepID=A0A0E9WSH6_ANGAN
MSPVPYPLCYTASHILPMSKGTMAVSYRGIKPVTFSLQDQRLTHHTTPPP